MAFVSTLPPNLSKRLHLPLCKALAETGALCSAFSSIHSKHPTLRIPVAAIHALVDSLSEVGAVEITAEHLGHMVEALLQQRLFDVMLEEAPHAERH